MRKPDFLIIGAAKSGTSSLADYLNQHPDIHIGQKEPHYFSKNFHKRHEWYSSHFSDKHLINGEKSTTYIYQKDAHHRIADYAPNAQLILMLREPVSRAYSNWNMRFKDKRLISDGLKFNKNNGGILKKLDFDYLANFYIKNQENEYLISQKPLDVIHRSKYSDQLISLLNYFPKEQINIIVFEKFRKDPATHLKDIFNFLGVENWEDLQFPVIKQADYKNPIDKNTKATLNNFFNASNEELFKLLEYKIEDWSNL